MVRRSLAEDRLGQVLPLGILAEDVLAVDVRAGVRQVVLGGGDAVVGDRLDGRLASGHAAARTVRRGRERWPRPSPLSVPSVTWPLLVDHTHVRRTRDHRR